MVLLGGGAFSYERGTPAALTKNTVLTNPWLRIKQKRVAGEQPSGAERGEGRESARGANE